MSSRFLLEANPLFSELGVANESERVKMSGLDCVEEETAEFVDNDEWFEIGITSELNFAGDSLHWRHLKIIFVGKNQTLKSIYRFADYM